MGHFAGIRRTKCRPKTLGLTPQQQIASQHLHPTRKPQVFCQTACIGTRQIWKAAIVSTLKLNSLQNCDGSRRYPKEAIKKPAPGLLGL
jgi:hypothetical protein